MVETVEASGTKEKEIGKKTDLPRSDMQGSILSRLDNILLMLQNNPQLAHDFGVDRANKTLTFDAGEDYAVSLFSDGMYLYVGLYTEPGKVVKIDLSTFTVVSTLTFDAGENNCRSCVFVSDEDYLYVGLATAPAKIIKIRLSDFTKVATLTFSVGVNYCNALFSDGTYLYAGLDTDPGKVAKIDLTNFTISATLTLDATESYCVALCSDGTYLYAGTEGNGFVVKIKLSDFTKVSSLQVANNCPALFSDGIYLYAGLDVSPAKIVKIDLETFTEVSRINCVFGEGNMSFSISDGTFLYSILPTYPSKIIKVDLATFVKVSTIAFASGENEGYSLFSDGTYLYVAFGTSPAKVARYYLYPTNASVLYRELKKLGGHITSPLIYTRPDRAGRIALTAGAGWAYGSYVEVVAADNITTSFKVIGIEISDVTVDKEYQIGIGTGAGGSEVLKQEIPIKSNVATESKTIMFDINQVPEIPAKTRVAAKCACETDSQGCGVKLIIATKY